LRFGFSPSGDVLVLLGLYGFRARPVTLAVSVPLSFVLLAKPREQCIRLRHLRAHVRLIERPRARRHTEREIVRRWAEVGGHPGIA
jgi:hypothetical protein